MDDIERQIKTMLAERSDMPEKDDAGIIDPKSIESNIERNVLEQVLKTKEVKE